MQEAGDGRPKTGDGRQGTGCKMHDAGCTMNDKAGSAEKSDLIQPQPVRFSERLRF